MKMVTKRGILLWILIAAFLFGAGFMTYSLVNNANTWVMKPFNCHIYIDGELVGAGAIKDRNGDILAQTVKGEREYSDSRTTRKSTLHIVGDTKGFISTGVQSVYKAKLTGYNLLFGVYSIKSSGKGNDLKLTIDSDACYVAYEALSNYKAGCVGVVNYKTGELLCSVSTPTFDPENVPSDINTNDEYAGAYINRLLTGLYTPGSTFKLITAVCAIENIPDIYDRTWKCTGSYNPGKGTPIECNARHGKLNFKDALAKSCNSTFAQIAIELGPEKLAATAKELGFTSPVMLNDDIQSSTGRFFLEKNDADDYVGWTGIGQGDTLVTPIEMLRFVSAVANDGNAVGFNVVSSLADEAGKALNIDLSTDKTLLLNSEVASKLKKMMRYNVTDHYGDYNYKGLKLCAKSGTAQVDSIDAHNTAWFTGFMDDEQHPYAFVVVVEYGNSGSKTAGRIANKVLQALVDE